LVLGRDIILVVHGGKYDILFLKEMKVDLHPLYVLDTQKAAQHLLGLDHRCTLQELLILLKGPFGFLHVAGNDATFTLRALLLIATIDSVNQPDLNHAQRSLLSALDEIAKTPLPLNWHQQEEEKIAKKKTKTEQRVA
jgi:hypothetical protein